MNSIASIISIIVIVCLFPINQEQVEAKLLRRSRYYEDSLNGPFDSPYGGGYHNQPIGGVATGERAIITVRGARNPYDGSAPSKIAIEDNPYRGPYPRGVYDRLDSGYGRRPMGYPHGDYGYSNLGLGGGYGGGYNNGYGSGMFGAPSRIGVTGAFPYGYGSRFGK